MHKRLQLHTKMIQTQKRISSLKMLAKKVGNEKVPPPPAETLPISLKVLAKKDRDTNVAR